MLLKLVIIPIPFPIEMAITLNPCKPQHKTLPITYIHITKWKYVNFNNREL